MGARIKERSSDEYLSDIIGVLQNSLEESLSLKMKLPKIKDRFTDEVSRILLDVFSLYRITCNNFENAILSKSSVRTFNKSLRYNRTVDLKINERIRDVFDDNKSFVILNKFWKLFKYKALRILNTLVKAGYNNGDSKAYIVKGKTECLDLYLSFISVILGTRYIQSKERFIFFIQPYYEKIPDVYKTLIQVCSECLKPGDDIVLSYRFFDAKYTIIPSVKIKNVDYINKLHDQGLNIYIACNDFYNEFDNMDYLVFNDKMDEYTD